MSTINAPPTISRHAFRGRHPRPHKLNANPALRRLVQRKLNRCWSPEEISGWLRRAHPDDKSQWLCPETIYRALLVPGGQGLHKRYCRKLRTGRRIRKSRWLTRSGHGAVVLRQYFPKGTDLSVHPDAHVSAVMSELNTRPRKSPATLVLAYGRNTSWASRISITPVQAVPDVPAHAGLGRQLDLGDCPPEHIPQGYRRQ